MSSEEYATPSTSGGKYTQTRSSRPLQETPTTTTTSYASAASRPAALNVSQISQEVLREDVKLHTIEFGYPDESWNNWKLDSGGHPWIVDWTESCSGYNNWRYVMFGRIELSEKGLAAVVLYRIVFVALLEKLLL